MNQNLRHNLPPRSPKVAQTHDPRDVNAQRLLPPSTEEDVLDELESLLVRMLIGTITFPFIRLPRLLYRMLRFISPAVIRLVRICFVASILGVIVFGPAAYAFGFKAANTFTAEHVSPPLASWMAAHSAIVRPMSYAWMVIATAGSFWGAIYIRRKRKSKLATGN